MFFFGGQFLGCYTTLGPELGFWGKPTGWNPTFRWPRWRLNALWWNYQLPWPGFDVSQWRGNVAGHGEEQWKWRKSWQNSYVRGVLDAHFGGGKMGGWDGLSIWLAGGDGLNDLASAIANTAVCEVTNWVKLLCPRFIKGWNSETPHPTFFGGYRKLHHIS